MIAICSSLKGNINCGCKTSDVAGLPRPKSCSTIEEMKKLPDKLEEDPLLPPKFMHCMIITNRFLELAVGDPSRNIIEMIFRASLSKQRKRSRRIRRVLKVNNPLDILAKFEKYREKVMISSNEQGHPRSIVDGNELLQFYGTTISCCHRNTEQVSELCRDPNCRVCRVIQSGFNTPYNKIYGVRLSMKSEEMSEDVSAFGKGKNAKKAAIICRTIAGRVMGVEGGKCEQEFESGVYSEPGSMIVRNPSAILPCFVIIFD